MLDAVAAQIPGQAFDFFDRDRTDQHRLPALVAVFDLFDDGGEFFFFRAEDDVGVVFADHGPVGRDHADVQIVDLGEPPASVSAVPVMPASFLYMGNSFGR